jgi:NAD(P)H-binding
MRIVVNTPAGNIGQVVTEQLLEAQEDVGIISRHPSNVTDLVKQAAHLVEGSIDDVGVLDKALKGPDELFWLTPLAFDQVPRSVSVYESIPLGRITGSICCQAGGSRWGSLPITPFSTAYKEGVKAASENDCGTLR